MKFLADPIPKTGSQSGTGETERLSGKPCLSRDQRWISIRQVKKRGWGGEGSSVLGRRNSSKKKVSMIKSRDQHLAQYSLAPQWAVGWRVEQGQCTLPWRLRIWSGGRDPPVSMFTFAWLEQLVILSVAPWRPTLTPFPGYWYQHSSCHNPATGLFSRMHRPQGQALYKESGLWVNHSSPTTDPHHLLLQPLPCNSLLLESSSCVLHQASSHSY